jgi:alpha-methylacyl-CoA racemase
VAYQKGTDISYKPLSGLKVLDLGILIPPALASNKLVALGADVVKVEEPGRGDRIRAVPPLADDRRSSQHMGYDWGKRSIALDLRKDDDRSTLLRLAEVADVIMENQLAGSWTRFGIDFAAMRARRPELIVCSLTGFGQTGPLSTLPSHGLNMDALADSVNVEWRDGDPHLGWTFTSWGNELGAANAAMAVCAAIAHVRAGGEGAWIDISCWDTLVEAHRTDIIVTTKTGVIQNSHDRVHGPLYDTYLSSDGKAVLLGALERKFWVNFCEGIGRPDLIDAHNGAEIDMGWDNQHLRTELAPIFASATAVEWDSRFIEWDCPGCTVLQVPDVMAHPHFAARELLEGTPGSWPLMRSAVRWHHTDERAGSWLSPPPEVDEHRDEILKDWLSS